MSGAADMPQGPVVQAGRLGKSYGAEWALRDVTLEVAGGEALAVFGANGAGKSTLIRLLATIMPPSTGSLQLFGYDAIRHRRGVRPAIGLLAHQSYLYAELTARENLALYAVLYGVADSGRRVGEALAAVGLAAAGDRRVRELSRGMQQRLALARATLHAPALLLLDEPDSGLDEAGRACLERLLAAGRARGQAIVLSTHHLELGLALCQRVLILRRGSVACCAPAGAHSFAEWRALYGMTQPGL